MSGAGSLVSGVGPGTGPPVLAPPGLGAGPLAGPGAESSAPQEEAHMRIAAFCTASASASTALTWGAEAGSPRRLEAASSRTRSTAWKRSCTARSTSGLSRTIWGKDMSQARSGSRACAPETSSVPRSSRRGPLPVTKASTASGSGGLRADDEELDLGGEVVEDRAAGDPGESGDVVDRHGRVTALTGQRQGGRPNGGAGAPCVGSAQVGPSHDPNHALSAELHSMQKVRDQSPVGEPAALAVASASTARARRGGRAASRSRQSVSASPPSRARAPAGHPMTVNTPGTPRREAPRWAPGPTARTRGRR